MRLCCGRIKRFGHASLFLYMSSLSIYMSSIIYSTHSLSLSCPLVLFHNLPFSLAQFLSVSLCLSLCLILSPSTSLSLSVSFFLPLSLSLPFSLSLPLSIYLFFSLPLSLLLSPSQVSKIMQPRVDIVGVPESATATEILQIVVENRYERTVPTWLLFTICWYRDLLGPFLPYFLPTALSSSVFYSLFAILLLVPHFPSPPISFNLTFTLPSSASVFKYFYTSLSLSLCLSLSLSYSVSLILSLFLSLILSLSNSLSVRLRYSRVPVYRGDVDNIVGVVYSKDLLEVLPSLSLFFICAITLSYPCLICAFHTWVQESSTVMW